MDFTFSMWLKTKNLKDLGVSDATYYRKTQSGEWKTRTVGKGRNGKPIREILLESLPSALQLEWIRRENALRSDSDAIEGSLTTDCIDSERRLTEALMRYEPKVREALLNDAVRLQSIVEKYDQINPKRVRNANGKHEFVSAVKQLCRDAVCSDAIVLSVEPKRGKIISAHTLDGWWRNSKSEGLCVFLRKPSSPPKPCDNRAAQIPASAAEFIEKTWRKVPSPKHLWKAAQKKADREGWECPSSTWFYRKYDNIPKVISAQTFGTSKDYQSKYAPYVPRDYSDIDVLQVLVGDHSVRDVSVVMPDGSLARAWLTLWVCMRSYMIWGWHLDVVPSSRTIGLAYANGCKTFGAQPLSRPEAGYFSYVYTDWGKDYRCYDLTGKTLTFKNAAKIEGGMEIITTNRKVGLLQELEIKHLLARPYNAKEKPVERIHRDISAWEQNNFPAEYCGRDANKPDRWRENWHRHQKLQKKLGKNIPLLMQESPFMDFGSYRENLEGFIAEHNSTGHQRSVLGGRTVIPIEEYNAMYSKVHITEEAMAFLLLKSAKKKIGKNGVMMTIEGYQLQFLHSEMSAHKGEDVEIRFTDNDFSHIWAILPATDRNPSRIVKADLVNRSGLLNPNKQTLGVIAKLANHERKLQRDFSLLNYSIIRGETTEDRAAQTQEIEQEQPQEIQLLATGTDGGNVHRMTRFDAPKIIGSSQQVSTAQVESAKIIDIFRSKPVTGKIKEEWED